MDTQMKQLARELTDAVSRAVAGDARVEACREKARAAGYEMSVSLEAVVAFTSREEAAASRTRSRRKAEPSGFEMSANDRRFLKSLRISPDESSGTPGTPGTTGTTGTPGTTGATGATGTPGTKGPAGTRD
jgi:hypothetical protein